MQTQRRLIFAGAAVFCAALLCGCPPPADSNDPMDSAAVKQVALDNDLGSRRIGKSSYSIKASQPVSSALPHQRVQLITSGVDPNYGPMTRIFNIRTGKQRTVRQTCERIHGLLQKFLAGPNSDTLLGQVGDVPGDGVRFIGVSSEKFRYDTYRPGVKNPESITLMRADVEAFDALLDEAIKKAR